jgi:undecaprenyl-diphosphatase
MILGRAVAACAVTGVIGIWLKDDFEEMFNSLRSVAGGFLITGALLLFVERLPSGNRSWRQLTWVGALLIGLAQAAAITPGVSRSGSTICIALLVGLRRRWAAEFSFLIAAPIILGATVLELSEVGLSGISRDKAAMLAIGALTSGVVGYGALKLLLRMLRNSKLHLFSYYLWTLGLCILMFWE